MIYSEAAQIIISIIPIVAITFAAVIVFCAVLWHHLETRMRIQKGTFKPVNFSLKTYSLLLGLCLTAIGAVLTFLFVAIHGISFSLMGGLLPFALGISLLIFYKINPEFKKKNNNTDNEI